MRKYLKRSIINFCSFDINTPDFKVIFAIANFVQEVMGKHESVNTSTTKDPNLLRVISRFLFFNS